MRLIKLILMLLILVGCNREENEFSFEIWCKCELSGDDWTKPISCDFFAFPDGEYSKVEKDTDKYGVAFATTNNGTVVRNIGFAYYNENSDSYATLTDYNIVTGAKPINEGTYYIACFPSKLGNSFPYKAKIFKKENNKGLIVNPIFTEKSYYNIDGYKYFEWDE